MTQLQLGDIIQFNAPDNDVLNNNIFLIDYLDDDKIKLVDVELSNQIILLIEDGKLKDATIEEISLLNRNEEQGYARQNGLLPLNWIDIYFDGDVPTIITGIITNLEEDMIELKSLNDDVIYIDFAYKGIPEELPIQKIVIREPPSSEKKEEETEETEVDDEVDLDVEPEATFVERMKEVLIDADEIKIGDDLEEITQLVRVKEGQERYGIDNQTNDLLDELLSTIPTTDRNSTVLRNVQIMIERYIQLRNKFSVFDEYGNALMPETKGAEHKPLVKIIREQSHKLEWLLPVIRTIKNIYDVDDVDAYDDIRETTLANALVSDHAQIDEFINGDRDYAFLLKAIQSQTQPFIDGTNEDTLKTVSLEEPILGIVNTLEDFFSSVAGDVIKRKRFYTQQGLPPFTKLFNTDVKNKFDRRTVGVGDPFAISSFIMLPHSIIDYSRIHLPKTSILKRANYNLVDFYLSKFFKA